jgi:hypothetical protein
MPLAGAIPDLSGAQFDQAILRCGWVSADALADLERVVRVCTASKLTVDRAVVGQKARFTEVDIARLAEFR